MNLKGKVKQLSWKIKETIYLSKPQQNIGDFFQFFFTKTQLYIGEPYTDLGKHSKKKSYKILMNFKENKGIYLSQ